MYQNLAFSQMLRCVLCRMGNGIRLFKLHTVSKLKVKSYSFMVPYKISLSIIVSRYHIVMFMRHFLIHLSTCCVNSGGRFRGHQLRDLVECMNMCLVHTLQQKQWVKKLFDYPLIFFNKKTV